MKPEMMEHEIGNVREMKPNYWIAQSVAENIKAEGDAIEKYERMLGQLDPISDAKAIVIIRELLADEKNHIIKLQHLLKCYDMTEPNKDGLDEMKKHKKVANEIFSKRKDYD